MLLNSDQAALTGSRLLPQSQNAIGQLASVRTVVLDTLVYTPFSGAQTALLHAYLAPKNLQIGTQIRFCMFGVATNFGVGNSVFAPVVRVTQGAPVQTLGFLSQIPASSTVAWRADATLTFSPPGGPNTLSAINQAKAARAYGPTRRFIVGGYLHFAQTDNGFASGTVQKGGNVLTGSPSSTTEILVATDDPNNSTVTFTSSDRVLITFEMDCGTTTNGKAQGGWMEALN